LYFAFVSLNGPSLSWLEELAANGKWQMAEAHQACQAGNER